MKKLIKKVIDYIKDNKLFVIINGICLLIVIFGFIIKILLGLFLMVLWLAGIVIYKKFGGIKNMLKRKKGKVQKENIKIKKKNKDELLEDTIILSNTKDTIESKSKNDIWFGS